MILTVEWSTPGLMLDLRHWLADAETYVEEVCTRYMVTLLGLSLTLRIYR